MRVDDWRHLPHGSVGPLYEAEALRWRIALHWETHPTLEAIERGRAAGTLPGFVVRGHGHAIEGWTYFVVQNGIVQIGALLARSSDGLRLLLDAVLKAPEASLAREVMCFVFPDSSACESALARRRFDVTRHWYLRRPLEKRATGTEPPPRPPLRPLNHADGPDAVRLLARAYAGQSAARCFAPNDRLDEWAHYFAHMTRGAALGALVPEATLVVAPPDRAVQGLAVTTSIAPGTLHLAQLVVDPAVQGQGLGGHLLDGALQRGAARGDRLMTLLVSSDQAVAHDLYTSRGFVPAGYFVSARRAGLRRSFPARAGADAALVAAR